MPVVACPKSEQGTPPYLIPLCSRAFAPRVREIEWSRDLREFCNLKLGDRILKKKWLGPRPEGVPPGGRMLTFEKNKLFFAKVKSLSDKLSNKESNKEQNRDKECQNARHFGKVGVEWQDFARPCRTRTALVGTSCPTMI